MQGRILDWIIEQEKDSNEKNVKFKQCLFNIMTIISVLISGFDHCTMVV